MKLKLLLSLLTGGFVVLHAGAQTYETNGVAVQTFVGSGFTGLVDGTGVMTMFNGPAAVVADSSSNLFVLDSGNALIRKVTLDGTVTTFAGGGGTNTGFGTNASVGLFGTMTIDRSNTLWLASNQSDYPSSTLVRIRSDGFVSRTNLAGIVHAGSLCVDSANNIYIADVLAHKIYRWRNNGTLEVFAGSGNNASIDGNGIFSAIGSPGPLAVDAADNIYVWDGSALLRRVNQNRDVVTLAGKYPPEPADGTGTNIAFAPVGAMYVDASGNLLLSSGPCLRKLTPTIKASTIAGSFTQLAYTNGPGNLARFHNLGGMCVVQGTIFVADPSNQRIRSISFDAATQVVANAALNLSLYPGLQITGVVGRTYRIESSFNHTNWNSEATILLTRSPYLWVDPNTAGQQQKFYRAFLLP